MVLRRAVSDAQVPQTPDAPLARGVGHRQSRPVTGSEIEEDLDQVRSSPPHPPPPTLPPTRPLPVRRRGERE